MISFTLGPNNQVQSRFLKNFFDLIFTSKSLKQKHSSLDICFSYLLIFCQLSFILFLFLLLCLQFFLLVKISNERSQRIGFLHNWNIVVVLINNERWWRTLAWCTLLFLSASSREKLLVKCFLHTRSNFIGNLGVITSFAWVSETTI